MKKRSEPQNWARPPLPPFLLGTWRTGGANRLARAKAKNTCTLFRKGEHLRKRGILTKMPKTRPVVLNATFLPVDIGEYDNVGTDSHRETLT